MLPGTGVEECIGMGLSEDPSCGGPVEDDEFCPSSPCGGEGGKGSGVVFFCLLFFLAGVAYAEA